MHACARSGKQKYGYIYIFLDENVSENGCIYIYIYIYIYILTYERDKRLKNMTHQMRFSPFYDSFNQIFLPRPHSFCCIFV